MKKMKQIVAVAIILAITTFTVTAKTNPPATSSPSGNSDVKMFKKNPEQKAKAETDTLSNVVGLTSEQYPKAYASNLNFATQKQALVKNNQGNFDAIKDQMKALNKTRKSEIAAILTPEQTAKWEAYKQMKKAQGETKKDE